MAGWSYQWITQLDWAGDSWTAPMDARRISPTSKTTTDTTAQVTDLTDRLRRADPAGTAPVFVFDAGYDPAALTHVAATVVVRIREDRVFTGQAVPGRGSDRLEWTVGKGPFLVLVTGYAAAGKTTVAPLLAKELDALWISRDRIHEMVYSGWTPKHPTSSGGKRRGP